MPIQKGDTVTVTKLCVTPNLRGLVGKVAQKPRNNHYIVKFSGDSQLYIFSEKEVAHSSTG